jgi:hypothetical protein
MADWIAHTAVEGVASAFTVLRELPPRPTERTGKLCNDLEVAARREHGPVARNRGPGPWALEERRRLRACSAHCSPHALPSLAAP